MASIDERQIIVKTPGAATSIIGRPPEPDREWLLLGLSREMNERIEELAMRSGDDKGDLINKAIGVLKFITDALDEGKRVGIASADQHLEYEFEDL